jgi:hypothetical protein
MTMGFSYLDRLKEQDQKVLVIRGPKEAGRGLLADAITGDDALHFDDISVLAEHLIAGVAAHRKYYVPAATRAPVPPPSPAVSAAVLLLEVDPTGEKLDLAEHMWRVSPMELPPLIVYVSLEDSIELDSDKFVELKVTP